MSAPTEVTLEEQQCEDHFAKSYTRDSEGRFTVCIPWKSLRPEIGLSRTIALRRLHSMEKRLQREDSNNSSHMNFRNEYNSFMREYLQLGHMSPAPPLSTDTSTYYIPHHFVIKKESTTTKFRVVFDASCPSSNGVSLNSAMMVGPTIQPALVNTICRFRLHPVAFTADIAKMYRQISLNKEDRKFHRILWRESTTAPVQEFVLNTVTYGTASAPYLATKCLQQLAIDEEIKYPLASKVALKDFYVDDLMSGAATLHQAKQIVNQLIQLCQSGGMELRKWASNSSQLMSSIPGLQQEAAPLIPLETTSTIKTLGIYWNTTTDTYQFKVQLPGVPSSGSYTKRIILSEMSMLFDPLGWLAPVTVKAKILMQDIWKLNIDWDEPLPSHIAAEWTTYKTALKAIENVSIPRLIRDGSQQQFLIGFSDASLKAYSAVVYICGTACGNINSYNLVSAKTRVAAIHSTTLPRLELNGAVLLADLMSMIQTALDITFDKIYAFSDSTITLGWIKSDPNKWKAYVRNRVIQINNKLPTAVWGHIAGKDNPADCASRGLNADDLANHDLWWNGPPIQLTQSLPDVDFSSVLCEEKSPKIAAFHSSAAHSSFILQFSALRRLQTFVAFIMRAQRNFRARKNGGDVVSRVTYSASELELALIETVKYVQGNSFQFELKCLQTVNGTLPVKHKFVSLNPFVDAIGLLRVGGRLRNAQVAEDVKHPILLPRDHHITTLIIVDAHFTTLHGGPQLTLCQINQRFWITRGRDIVRNQLKKCVICTRRKAITMKNIMGDLPEARVTQSRPFSKCGLDYAGPLLLRNEGRSKIQYKAYLALFICFATRAIHLEVVNSLSTSSVIAALRRFSSRRGRPSDIYSDCGTNFIGARRVIGELEQLIIEKGQDLERSTAADGIQWHFNPPSAPHFGCLWEAGVKSVKYHLHRVMGERALTYEEMLTLVVQIEGILNSRPLTQISTDPNDLSVLTPAHFLIGAPLVSFPDRDHGDTNPLRLDRWQFLQSKMQSFWRRWSKEFITRMQQRPKWMQASPMISADQIVIIKEDNLPPGKWKLGRVIETHPGKDGIVRVVT